MDPPNTRPLFDVFNVLNDISLAIATSKHPLATLSVTTRKHYLSIDFRWTLRTLQISLHIYTNPPPKIDTPQVAACTTGFIREMLTLCHVVQL